MKRTIVVIGAVAAIAIAAAAAPWVIGWRAEQIVRARVAQVDADKNATIRLRIDSYERGWGDANARISVVDRTGAPLMTLPAVIRHWPFARGGPADWVAVPELGQTVRDALGPWGVKLPELSLHTTLSWLGDVSTRIESPALKRRVPEVAGGSFEIGAIEGTVDWRRNGALAYDIALPVLRVDRQPFGRTDVANVVEFRDAVLKGEGSLGTVERRWNQSGSLTASSVLLTEGGKTVLTATKPVITYASRDEGEHVDMQFAVAISAVSATHAVQNLSDAAIEIGFDARRLAKEPLGRLLDAAAPTTVPPTVKVAPGTISPRAAPKQPPTDMFDDLLRGSPAADLRFILKAREGRVEIKLALAFDGLGYETRSSETWLQRFDAELDARATTSLVVNATRAGAALAAGMLQQPGRAATASPAVPDVPSRDSEATARLQLQDAATQGWIRIEGDEVATTVRWRNGNLVINGQNMNLLRDLVRGITGR